MMKLDLEKNENRNLRVFSMVSAKCSIYYFFIQTISVQLFLQDKSLRQKYPLITCLSCNGHIMATHSPLVFFFWDPCQVLSQKTLLY